jgi:transposase InsO family protein
LVQRDFTATRPDQLWVADLTYVEIIAKVFPSRSGCTPG